MKEYLRRFIKSTIWGSLYFFQRLKSLRSTNFGKGAFLITIDIETACDFIHWMDKESAVRKAYQNRKMIEKIINFSKEHHFPLTWLCTGHSLLKSCSGHKSRIYSWVTARNGFVGNCGKKDWFEHDPCGNHLSHPEWYFGDLFEKITKDPLCEIGSHTFGHIRADLATEAEFTQDMTELSLVHKRLGLKCQSFAFPWNKVTHEDKLRDFGIKVGRLKKGYFPSSIVEPVRDSSSMMFVYESFEGRPASFQVLKYGIDLAAKKGCPFVWLVHPDELLNLSDWGIFYRTADYILSLQKMKKVLALTMKEVVEY